MTTKPEVWEFTDVIPHVCCTRGDWALYLSVSGQTPSVSELRKCVPYLSYDDAVTLLTGPVVIFGDKEDILRWFWATVGDDGPTKTNPYTGPAKVFATTWGDDGLGRNQNT